MPCVFLLYLSWCFKQVMIHILYHEYKPTVNASNFGGVPNFGGSKKWDSLVPCIHFLDKHSFARFKSNSLSKKWMQDTNESWEHHQS